MKLFYLKYTVFESSYRCEMVRKRLIKFLRKNKPDALIISGINDQQAKIFSDFTKRIDNLSLKLITRNGKHTLENHTILLSDSRLLLDKRVIAPIEGCVTMIDLEPYALHYIVLDIFADENFADYHGELDEGHLQELHKLLRNK